MRSGLEAGAPQAPQRATADVARHATTHNTAIVATTANKRRAVADWRAAGAEACGVADVESTLRDSTRSIVPHKLSLLT